MKFRSWIGGLLLCSLMFLVFAQHPARPEEVCRDVPGELIVSFIVQNQPVMSLSPGSITSIYETLNDVLDQFHMSTVTPLYCPNSPQQNVFVFKFPIEVDVNEVVRKLERMPFIKGVEKNLLMRASTDYIPSDYACQHDWYCNGSGGGRTRGCFGACSWIARGTS